MDRLLDNALLEIFIIGYNIKMQFNIILYAVHCQQDF
jgi:hypothetical protein